MTYKFTRGEAEELADPHLSTEVHFGDVARREAAAGE